MPRPRHITQKKIDFLIITGIFLVLTGSLFLPYLKLLALAGILAVLFLPLHKLYVRKLGGRETLAAALTITSILLITGIPLYFLSQAVLGEVAGFYNDYADGRITIDPQIFIQKLPSHLQPAASTFAAQSSLRINKWIQDIADNTTNIISNVAGFFFSLFIVLFAAFYFLKDREKIMHFTQDLSPLPKLEEERLTQRAVSAINGVVRGNFLTAILQGTVAGVGFVMASVSAPLFWGFATAVSSLIPVVGTAVIIVPIILYLFLIKSISAGLLLAAWYSAMHLLIDSIIAPKLISKQVSMHPLLVLLSVLGGLELFGSLGFLFGPIIVAITLAIIETFRARSAFKKL